MRSPTESTRSSRGAAASITASIVPVSESSELTGQYATATVAVDLPHVPLEAGAGPENPPCPACGEPLFPWVGMPVGTGIAHRCEACGLGVLSHGEKFFFPKRVGERQPGETKLKIEFSFDPGSTGDVLKELELDRTEDGSYEFENRDSLCAALTGGAWSGLGTDRRYRLTPKALTDAIATRDQVVTGTRFRPLKGIAAMWQSGINMFTFGQNIALGSFGKATKVAADHGWKTALDWFISIVLAIPALVIAAPLELIAIAFRKGCAARSGVQVL